MSALDLLLDGQLLQRFWCWRKEAVRGISNAPKKDAIAYEAALSGASTQRRPSAARSIGPLCSGEASGGLVSAAGERAPVQYVANLIRFALAQCQWWEISVR